MPAVIMLATLIALAAGVSNSAAAADAPASDDPFLWLEDVTGERALGWAKKETDRSLEDLTAHPDFKAMQDEALEILTAETRVAEGSFHKGNVYNFWVDTAHMRGIWRRASIESYAAGAPEWETLIDFDALAEAENENWIKGDIVCLKPEFSRCMVEMSRGGSDAAVWREFDLETKTFVDGGFFLPEAKTSLAWVDEDMLLVASDFGEGSLTTSGYARTVRAFERGGDLAASQLVFEAARDDVWVTPIVERTPGRADVFIQRARTFYDYDYVHATPGEPAKRLPLPSEVGYVGVLSGSAVFVLRAPWRREEVSYAQGSVVAYDLAAGTSELIFAPSESQSVEGVEIAGDDVIVQYLDDVVGKAARLQQSDDGDWVASVIELPDNGVVTLVSATKEGAALFAYESMTQPTSLLMSARDGAVTTVAESPPAYDADGVVVEKRFAVSADGARVPYFVMAREDVLKGGPAPTVQYGYGGFLSAILPQYLADPARPQNGALAGKMWIARGGVLVLSCIRGGSEYGPRWHQAALKEKRQRSFDDFIAISEALIETGVTTPEKLGAVGRSNGGLLMGAVMTQRPDLYAAVDIGVPLFDMKRYTKLLAGASWIGEYGDPDKAEDWSYIGAYSPYQKLAADQAYPTPFFYTSTKDDRVHPGHARKAAAKMRELGYDFLYYENFEGGHGGTANQEQLAFRTALEFVYFAKMLMSE